VLGIYNIDVMILQICTDYAGIPDFRTMSIDEIIYFYKPLIPGLIEAQKKSKDK
jgi:hypothetical protein